METEQKIRELLVEAGQSAPGGLDVEMTPVAGEEVQFREIKTPEIYFGYDHGGFLGNPRGFKIGAVDYLEPSKLEENLFYLVGKWTVGMENVQYVGEGAGRIILRYTAKSVNIVAGAPGRIVEVEVLLDGKSLTRANAGKDIQFDRTGRSIAMIQEGRLYSLVHDQAGYGLHTLTLIVSKKGLQAYTFTFG